MTVRLLLELTKRDFTERYSGSVLGVAWSFLWPLVNITIYTVVFSNVMKAKMPEATSQYGYSVYLVAGLIPWIAFSNTFARSASVFVDKKHIISKVRISLPMLPLYIMLSESITFVISMLIFAGFLVMTHSPVHDSIILLPFIFLTQQIFAYAAGFLAAIFHVFLRDLREVVGIITQVWFWFTPIVYVESILPDFARNIIIYNPAYLFIQAYHAIFSGQDVPRIDLLLALAALAHVLFFLAFFLYKKLERDIRDFV